MVRIRYGKQTTDSGTTLISTSVFDLKDGRKVIVKLVDNSRFSIIDVSDNSEVAFGESPKKNPTYLKRIAKKILVELMGESSFTKEVRKRLT